MQPDLKTAASRLAGALEGANHPHSAVHVATVAAQRGLAPSTTVQLLEGVHPPAAEVAKAIFGSAENTPDAADAAATSQLKPSQLMSAAIRSRLGIGTDRAA